MSPEEHYSQAEALLKQVASNRYSNETNAGLIARAQVHATLATVVFTPKSDGRHLGLVPEGSGYAAHEGPYGYGSQVR